MCPVFMAHHTSLSQEWTRTKMLFLVHSWKKGVSPIRGVFNTKFYRLARLCVLHRCFTAIMHLIWKNVWFTQSVCYIEIWWESNFVEFARASPTREVRIGCYFSTNVSDLNHFLQPIRYADFTGVVSKFCNRQTPISNVHGRQWHQAGILPIKKSFACS